MPGPTFPISAATRVVPAKNSCLRPLVYTGVPEFTVRVTTALVIAMLLKLVSATRAMAWICIPLLPGVVRNV